MALTLCTCGSRDAGTELAPATPLSDADTVIHIPVMTPFESAFVAVDSFHLEQNDEHVVANVTDVVVDPSGELIHIVDVSEGNVKTFDLRGHLVQVLGRKGEGPGEFNSPIAAAVDGAGRIAVLDVMNTRITLFTPTGTLVRTVQLRGMSRVPDFAITPSGGYTLLAMLRPDHDVLVVADSNGEVHQTGLPLARVVPPGETDGPLWDFPRMFFLGAKADTAFVVLSLLPRLWLVDLPSMRVRAVDVVFPGYTRPTLPSGPAAPNTAQAMRDWFYSRHLSGFIRLSRNEVFWLFIKGELMDNKPNTAVHRLSSGEWRAYTSVPLIVAAFPSGKLLVLRDPDADTLRLVIYEQ